jgi:hypothetical protein
MKLVLPSASSISIFWKVKHQFLQFEGARRRRAVVRAPARETAHLADHRVGQSHPLIDEFRAVDVRLHELDDDVGQNLVRSATSVYA